MDRYEETKLMAEVWKENYKRQKYYPDGKTIITYLTLDDGTIDYTRNRYGYPHRTTPCQECGEWECDPLGLGHYRG